MAGSFTVGNAKGASKSPWAGPRRRAVAEVELEGVRVHPREVPVHDEELARRARRRRHRPARVRRVAARRRELVVVGQVRLGRGVWYGASGFIG